MFIYVVQYFFYLTCIPILLSGSGVSLQVYHPVSDPLLQSYLWYGGGAVSNQHPGTLSVHPLRPQPRQPKLRDPYIHSGEIAQTELSLFALIFSTVNENYNRKPLVRSLI